MKRKKKENGKESWKQKLPPRYLAAIKAIRAECGCGFQEAENLFVEKHILKEWREKKAKV